MKRIHVGDAIASFSAKCIDGPPFKKPYPEARNRPIFCDLFLLVDLFLGPQSSGVFWLEVCLILPSDDIFKLFFFKLASCGFLEKMSSLAEKKGQMNISSDDMFKLASTSHATGLDFCLRVHFGQHYQWPEVRARKGLDLRGFFGEDTNVKFTQ